jgi:hypothetical protein
MEGKSMTTMLREMKACMARMEAMLPYSTYIGLPTEGKSNSYTHSYTHSYTQRVIRPEAESTQKDPENHPEAEPNYFQNQRELEADLYDLPSEFPNDEMDDLNAAIQAFLDNEKVERKDQGQKQSEYHCEKEGISQNQPESEYHCEREEITQNQPGTESESPSGITSDSSEIPIDSSKLPTHLFAPIPTPFKELLEGKACLSQLSYLTQRTSESDEPDTRKPPAIRSNKDQPIGKSAKKTFQMEAKNPDRDRMSPYTERTNHYDQANHTPRKGEG